jgi:hypothetical protein
MVRQNPDWFVASPADALSLEVSNESTQRRFFANEAAVASPFDQVDIDINLANIASRCRATAPVYSRDCQNAASAKKREVRVIETVPWWYQDGKRSAPEEARQSLSACGEVNSHGVAGARGRKFTLAPARRMVRMTPTVLEDSNARSRRLQPIRQLWFCLGGNDRERDWTRPRDPDLSIKTCTWRHCVVITPPQLRNPLRFSPTVEFID